MAVGVIKKLKPEDRSFYTAGDVQALMDVSESKAYKMIRAMRNECVAAKLISPAYPMSIACCEERRRGIAHIHLPGMRSVSRSWGAVRLH